MASKPAGAPADGVEEIATIRVALLDAEPAIWRRVDVPTALTLKQLHDVVQAAMGWFDQHMWEFRVGEQTYGHRFPDDDDWRDPPMIEAAKVKLAELLKRGVTELAYIYDFGDHWEHALTVTDVRAGDPGVRYPRYLDGERAAPPEDCGGLPGYYNALDILADPAHPEHADVADWLGDHDPEQFWDVPPKVAISRIANRRRAARGPRAKRLSALSGGA